MNNTSLTIGYTIEKAIYLIGQDRTVIIDSTSTPYKDKIEERKGNTPVVVRQKEECGKILLTTSIFK